MLCFEAKGVLSSLFFLSLKLFPVVGMRNGRPKPRPDLCLISNLRLGGLPSGLVVEESPQ